MKTRIAIGVALAVLGSAAPAFAAHSRICEIAWTWGGVYAFAAALSGC